MSGHRGISARRSGSANARAQRRETSIQKKTKMDSERPTVTAFGTCHAIEVNQGDILTQGAAK
jgi:hypothetical protein